MKLSFLNLIISIYISSSNAAFLRKLECSSNPDLFCGKFEKVPKSGVSCFNTESDCTTGCSNKPDQFCAAFNKYPKSGVSCFNTESDCSSFNPIPSPTNPPTQAVTASPTLSVPVVLPPLPDVPSSTCPNFAHSDRFLLLQRQALEAAKSCSREVSDDASFVTKAKFIMDKLGVVDKVTTKVKTILKSIGDKIRVLLGTIKKFSFVKSFPYAGQVIATVEKILTPVEKVEGATSTTLDKFKKVATALYDSFKLYKDTRIAAGLAVDAQIVPMRLSYEVTERLVTCAASTGTCDDDNDITAVALQLNSPAEKAVAGYTQCANKMGKMNDYIDNLHNALANGAFEKLESLVDTVYDKLNPFLEAVTKIIDLLKSEVTEFYCCNTPSSIQMVISKTSDIMDVATCGIDALFESFATPLQQLITNIIADLVNPLMEPMNELKNNALQLSSVGTSHVEVSESSDSGSCSSIRDAKESGNAVDTGSSVFANLQVFQVEPVVFPNVIGNIKETCRDAVDDLQNSPADECCSVYPGAVHIDDKIDDIIDDIFGRR